MELECVQTNAWALNLRDTIFRCDRRECVCLALRFARRALGSRVSEMPTAPAALAAAEQWVLWPTPENAEAARRAALLVDLDNLGPRRAYSAALAACSYAAQVPAAKDYLFFLEGCQLSAVMAASTPAEELGAQRKLLSEYMSAILAV